MAKSFGLTVSTTFWCRKYWGGISTRTRHELKNWFLRHNSARLHTNCIVLEYLEHNNIKVLPHPPYSQDLAPCDFWIISMLKKALLVVTSHWWWSSECSARLLQLSWWSRFLESSCGQLGREYETVHQTSSPIFWESLNLSKWKWYWCKQYVNKSLFSYIFFCEGYL